ncbi:CgeB family protein [Pontivivens ytuae]|uniref:Glycosyltransferase family 1 protein n=1 Tax=Pontivivens ytuae TaxID=2789856 RepID=A0A7S9LV76_9RHOB|nr:glycosyltransferase [Pontivivens ytuae]QPH55936.1 glycosyltransferase family 1 protein [Pontivivens ytuae]
MADEPLSIRLKIAPTNMARAQRWGDFFFARSLGEALKARGHSVEIDARDQWYADRTPGGVDLVLRGFGGFEPIPGRAALMWMISHPGNVQLEEMKAYHHVFTAAGGGLRRLRIALGRGRISHLFQATDPQIMRPRDVPVDGSMLFVGINRRGGRPALAMAERCGYEVALWGNGWEEHPNFSRFARGSFIPNEELGAYYSAAGVVLNDHWRDMRLNGLISNRVFDVLACGAPLLSDKVRGLPADLAEWIYTFDDEASFREGAKAALAEGPERRAERRAFAEVVRREHSFHARAASIEAQGRRVLAEL